MSDDRRALGESEIARALAELPRWRYDGGALRTTVLTRDFSSALALAVAIGDIANAANHHPDLGVHWGRLEVAWSTHDAPGVTGLDLAMARRCEPLLPPR